MRIVQIQGQMTSADAPLTVLEVGLGGMSIETEVELAVGARHEFELTLGDGASVLLTGLVRHCRPIEASSPPLFKIGIEFVADATEPGVADERTTRFG